MTSRPSARIATVTPEPSTLPNWGGVALMLVSASGFNCGSFAVPQMRGDVAVGDLGLRATLALGTDSTTREPVAGPSDRASVGDIFATTAFMKLNEEMCVAPLARSDCTIGACSDLTADVLATERAPSEPF